MRQVEIAQEECYCPVEVLMLPDAKHVPHREAPEETLAAVVDFVKRALKRVEVASAGLVAACMRL